MTAAEKIRYRVEVEATVRACLAFELRARREIAAIRALRQP